MQNIVIDGEIYYAEKDIIEIFDYASNYIVLRNLLNEIENAVRRTYTHPKELDENLKMLDNAWENFSEKHEYPFLMTSCSQLAIRNFMGCVPKEKDICSWFKAKVNRILGEDYRIVKRKNDPKNIPDFWLLHNSEYIPVEVKLCNFTTKCLEQLERYMAFYKCKSGIAVGRELTCSLPDNIYFIKYDIDEVEEYIE